MAVLEVKAPKIRNAVLLGTAIAMFAIAAAWPAFGFAFIAVALICLMLLATSLSDAGHLSKALRPFRNRPVEIRVWGEPLPGQAEPGTSRPFHGQKCGQSATGRAEAALRYFEFDLYASRLVVAEAQLGDPAAADARLAVLEPITLLTETSESRALAQKLLTAGGLPECCGS